MASDQVNAALDASEEFLDTVRTLLETQILESWPDQIPGIDPIARALDSQIATADTTLESAITSVKTQLEPLIQNAIPSALDFLAAISQSLDEHLAQLIGNIATTEDVLGAAIGTLKSNAPNLAKWIYEEVSGGLGATILNVLKEIEHQETSGIDATLDHLLKLPHAPPFFTTLVNDFRGRGAEWQALALPALLIGAILGAVSAIEEPFRIATVQGAFDQMPVKEAEPPVLVESLIRQGITKDRFVHGMRQNGYAQDIAEMYENVRTVRLDPEVLTRLYIRGEVDRQFWESAMEQRGYDTDRARLQWMATLQLLPEEDIRSAFLRGIYDAKQHDAALAQYGYSADLAHLRRTLYFFIPPAQDLIHMAIRNVFNPQIVDKFQLFGDFPEPFKTAAAQQGISEYWAKNYWGAHWIVPSNEEGFSMFQRTTDAKLDSGADTITLDNGKQVHNIIGRDTLHLLLREKDIAPFYRDKLIELSYRPLTRIDIRRLNKVGLLDKAGVERAYLDLGYKPHNALLLADFTEKLNAATTKDAAQGLITNLRRKVLELYVQDKLSADDVATTLTDLGFTDAETKVFLAEADLVQESEYISAVEAGIGKLYVAGIIDASTANQRLTDANVPPRAILTLFEKWDLAIEFKGGSEHLHKHRELTKTEVLESFTDGLMDQPTAETMLEDLGYDQASADAEINLALYKQLRASRRAQVDAIKAMYINGIKELLDTSNALDGLYVPPSQRDAYLAEWTLQRETRTERIPIATLRDMVRKSGFMDDTTAMSHLKRHRFTDDDATLLLRFWHGAQ